MNNLHYFAFVLVAMITGCDPVDLAPGVSEKSSNSSDAGKSEDPTPSTDNVEDPNAETTEANSRKDGSCLRESGRFKSADGGCKELKTGFVFSLWATDGGEGDELTFKEAQDHCNKLSDGGFKDWVLPTIDELASLEGNDRGYSHLDFDTTKYFWTMTYKSYESIMYTSIRYSGKYSDKPEDRHHVVCVRATPASKNKGKARDPGACLNEDDRFRSEDGGCKELKTGRVFSAPAKDGDKLDTLTHPGGKTYCENLTEGGKSDWRMPTYDELYSLYGEDRGQSHINAPANNYYWTTDFKAADKPYYTSIRHSGKYSDDINDKHQVICVR